MKRQIRTVAGYTVRGKKIIGVPYPETMQMALCVQFEFELAQAAGDYGLAWCGLTIFCQHEYKAYDWHFVMRMCDEALGAEIKYKVQVSLGFAKEA